MNLINGICKKKHSDTLGFELGYELGSLRIERSRDGHWSLLDLRPFLDLLGSCQLFLQILDPLVQPLLLGGDLRGHFLVFRLQVFDQRLVSWSENVC